jgi:tetratricopeptide (TPR) repeat protein
MKTRLLILHLIVAALWMSQSPVAQAALTSDEATTLFKQANDAFAQALEQNDTSQAEAQFEKSILLFERLIEEGDIDNAKLYYNLANAHLHNHNIGKAILNYRRAEALDQNNEDIQKNLTFARSRRIDQVDLETQTRILHTLFFWHYDFGLQTRFMLACIFFGLTCICLTLLLWRKRRSAYLIGSLICLGLCLCLAVSIGITQVQNRTTHFGVITAPQITARQGDSDSFPPSFKDPLHAGTEFLLLEARPNWLHIQLDNGSKAWIPDDAGDVI